MDVQREFKQETGLDYRFIIALYESGSGGPAEAEDAEAYDEVIGKPKFPILADPNEKVAGATPMDTLAHPQMCALSDELVILGCYTGHGAYEDALDDIRAHAGL